MTKPRARPSVPYKLVVVEWEDSAQPISTWQWVDEYAAPDIVACVSVGYLIAKTRHALALAPNLGDLGRDRVQASGILRIPLTAVRRMTEL